MYWKGLWNIFVQANKEFKCFLFNYHTHPPKLTHDLPTYISPNTQKNLRNIFMRKTNEVLQITGG